MVKQAHDANIPVVCYNTCLNDDDAKALVYALVTTDQYKLGYDAGAAAADYFTKKGVAAPRFGILGCDVYEACRQRKAGFKDAVTKGVPGAVWAADQDGYEAGKATTTATNMLTGDTAIDGLFANNENGVIAAMQGVETTGRNGKVAVFGNDIDPQIAQYLLQQPGYADRHQRPAAAGDGQGCRADGAQGHQGRQERHIPDQRTHRAVPGLYPGSDERMAEGARRCGWHPVRSPLDRC